MTVHSAFFLALAILVFAITPGPGVFALVSRSLQGGAAAGLSVAAGLLSADLVYLSIALAGLAFVAYEFHELFFVVRLAGGCYLLWLGIRAWRRPIAPMREARSEQPTLIGDLKTGFVTTAHDPKIVLFYLGLLSYFVDMHALTTTCFFEAGAIVTAMLVLGALLCIGVCTRARRLLDSAEAVRSMNRASAVVFSVAGLFVASGAGDAPAPWLSSPCSERRGAMPICI